MHDPGSTCDHTESAVLFANGLRKTYGGRAVVDGVSMTVQPREIVGLLGPNGAGKTTSFYMIAGLIPADAGSVCFKGHDISHMPMHRRARLGLGYLPQEESVFRKLSVIDNLLAILETRPNLSRSDRHDRAHDLMDRFGITRLAKSLAITLSGGEKRRLAIARSLCSDLHDPHLIPDGIIEVIDRTVGLYIDLLGIVIPHQSRHPGDPLPQRYLFIPYFCIVR